MARNNTLIAVSPDELFEVLSNPMVYGDWVVGSHSIRDADEAWPAVGSRFYHRVGAGPFTVNDHTEVVEVERPRRLVLHARARPLGTAKVELQLDPHEGGTRVTMIESAGDLLSRVGINPLTDPLVHIRNRISLRRLRRIAQTGVVKT